MRQVWIRASLETCCQREVEPGNQSGAQFGFALAAGDFNADGKDDLAIGTPFMTFARLSGDLLDNAGEVAVIEGSTSGLGGPFADTVVFNRDSLASGTAEAGALFGSALTAWNFGRNEVISGSPPFQLVARTSDLAIGSPLATVAGLRAAGAVDVLYGSFFSGGLNLSTAPQRFTGTPSVSDQGPTSHLAPSCTDAPSRLR